MAKALRAPLYTQKGSTGKNGYVESYDGRPRPKLLGRHLVLRVPDARAALEESRKDYTQRRTYRGLEWIPRLPQSMGWAIRSPATH